MTTDNITRRPRRPERVIKLLVKGMVILIEVANDLTDVLEEAYSAAEAEGWAPEERERWRAALEKARCEVIGAARVKGRVAMLRRERRIASQEERQLALAEALPGLAKVLHDLADALEEAYSLSEAQGWAPKQWSPRGRDWSDVQVAAVLRR